MKRRASVQGFTLIEILVVLVIMGLMAGAMVMIGGDNREDIARDEIEKLNAKLKLALEEAQLHGVEFGLVVTETDYRFVTFGNDRWSAISDDNAYSRYQLPDGFELALQIEDFKLAGARLPGARITDDGKVVTADADDRDAQADRRQKKAESEKDDDKKTRDGSDAGSTDAGGNAEQQEEEEPASLLPQVFLLSSGELNPFLLAIGNRDQNPVFYRLRGTIDGDIKLEGPIRADPVDELAVEWDNPDPEALPTEDTEQEGLLNDDGERKPADRKRAPAAGARDGGK